MHVSTKPKRARPRRLGSKLCFRGRLGLANSRKEKGGLENPQGEDKSKANASDQGQQENAKGTGTMSRAAETPPITSRTLNKKAQHLGYTHL